MFLFTTCHFEPTKEFVDVGGLKNYVPYSDVQIENRIATFIDNIISESVLFQ